MRERVRESQTFRPRLPTLDLRTAPPSQEPPGASIVHFQVGDVNCFAAKGLWPRTVTASSPTNSDAPRWQQRDERHCEFWSFRNWAGALSPLVSDFTDLLDRSLYRRSLKLALDWAVHRHLWRGQALYIRSLFEANRNVTDLRQQRVHWHGALLMMLHWLTSDG